MKRFFFFLLPLLLISCASGRLESDFSPVYVTNSAKFYVLGTNFMSGRIEGFQRMNASFGENEFEADVYVIADKSQLSMSVISEFGATLAELFYDGKKLDFESSVFPKNLKAEYIVADFQFCLYDEEALKSALKKSGIDFVEYLEEMPDGNSEETRILLQKGKEISKITKKYEKNLQTSANELKSIKYENFLRGYSYELSGDFE